VVGRWGREPLPAVDHQRLPGDPAGPTGREEHDRAADVVGLTDPGQRDVGGEPTFVMAPAATSAPAMASPMPRDAPVTIAV